MCVSLSLYIYRHIYTHTINYIKNRRAERAGRLLPALPRRPPRADELRIKDDRLPHCRPFIHIHTSINQCLNTSILISIKLVIVTVADPREFHGPGS